MLKNLKSLPVYKRKQLALGSAILFTFIVFSFWLASLDTIFAVPGQVVAEEKTGEPSPTAALIQSFSTFFGSIQEKVKALTVSEEAQSQ
jgi:hypothetical protein